MKVGFNPNVSFRSSSQAQQSVAEKPASNALKNDEVTLSDKNAAQGNKKKPFRNFIANVAKFFATTTEMVKGTFKGAGYGAATAGGILAVGWLFGALPQGFRKGGSLKEVCKNPIKSIGTKTKVGAAVAAVAVLAGHIISAKLKANQKTADIDHQLKVGHRN